MIDKLIYLKQDKIKCVFIKKCAFSNFSKVSFGNKYEYILILIVDDPMLL